ncbi:MAG: DUF2442 domain-containing protein [Patescibacteria group bacterium]|nr:DUF2442 domain-containing protein [Patescibacteria group bacterium]MBU1160421.1 DUF2442 domain-containing protein [Patescibacteria group bacterium]MBU1684122.1 DUF2442 domain-containing protein [Patescibacteria group bacterium]MBU1987611.1 DUF2442 domain-containing protein [Patescibacteria group bacterium]MBU2416101.1 DUF2442 domain-containing protein [Patescibacteria group bacterium]
MLHKINKIKYLDDYRLELFFDNNKSGEVDLNKYLWGEVFEQLKANCNKESVKKRSKEIIQER